MALALPLLAGLVLAPLLGGRWSRIGALRLRAVWIFYVAIVLQFAAFPFKTLPWRTSDRIGIVLWLCSFGLFALGAARNLRIVGVRRSRPGCSSTSPAIVSNGGHMPALPSALRAAGIHFTPEPEQRVDGAPHLAWLVDRWALPAWVPWGNVFSVGDVLIAAGGLLFVLGATGALRPPSIVLRRRAASSA